MNKDFYISPAGDENNPGTCEQPFKSLVRAQAAIRECPERGKQTITVYLMGGTYYLEDTLRFTSEDSGSADAPVTYTAYPDADVVISGGARLSLQWEPYQGGVLQAATPVGLDIDQLFVNGERQHMARYPNYDPEIRPLNGFAADAFSPERTARWKNPTGGYIHAMHSKHWGGYHYRITGKNPDGTVAYEGGWQNNRQMGMHDEHRFVENIFEELDAPGEWFHDPKTQALYFYPPENVNVDTAIFEIAQLKHLVEFNGTPEKPVRHIQMKGMTFRHAARTIMEPYERLLRSDWSIYRGGAVLFAGTENCGIADCEFDQVGGNAVFVSGYNRRIVVRGTHIHGAGASGVCFVGDVDCVRSPLFERHEHQAYEDIDKTPGPKTDNYPADCRVEDCLIHNIGVVEKQAAGVQISMSSAITVRHCSIYDLSRSGINISEGTFGGHLIEFCDVFDTVRETDDHGSFNSWGRDRYWELVPRPRSKGMLKRQMSEAGGFEGNDAYSNMDDCARNSQVLLDGAPATAGSISRTPPKAGISRHSAYPAIPAHTSVCAEITGHPAFCGEKPARSGYTRLTGPYSEVEAPEGECPEDPAEIMLLDAEKTIIRDSRWRCDHGWDVDLDDGSSNYEIYNNLFLRGGLKLREGYFRHVYNNIAINSTLHPHVWFENNRDIVTNNVWMAPYRPVMKHWGGDIDHNFFVSDVDRKAFAEKGCDANSFVGDPQFVNPATGDYRLGKASPFLKHGFKNFPMDQFGVKKPALKAIARTPDFPIPILDERHEDGKPTIESWMEAEVAALTGEQFSAFGVKREDGGIHLVTVPADSVAAREGLMEHDLIQRVNGCRVRTVKDLRQAVANAGRGKLRLRLVRNIKTQLVEIEADG